MSTDSKSSLFSRPAVAIGILIVVWGGHCLVDLSFFRKAEVPPFYDAANHVNIALDIKDHFDRFRFSPSWFRKIWDLSGYYPPGFHIIAALLLKFGSFTLDGVRLTNLLFLAVLMFSVWGIGKKLFDTETGLLAGILVSLFPIVHGLTREIYIDLALLAWAACAVFLLIASDRFRSVSYSFLFGIACGLGLLTKWTFPVFVGGPVLWVLSEAFLPFSIYQLGIGALTSGLKIESRSRVHRAALTVGGWFLFVFSMVQLIAKSGLFLPWTFFSFLGLGCLFLGQSGRRSGPNWKSVVEEARRKTPGLKKPLIGILTASIPMLLLAGPWYARHFNYIAYEGGRVLTEAAKVRGMPEVGTLSSFLYYFLTLESHQLHLPFWLLAIVSFGSLFYPVARRRSLWFLGTAFAVSYLVMSTLWVKDPRYFMPALYVLPVVMAWWVLNHDPDRRSVWVVSVLAVGLVGALNQLYGLPLLSARLEVPTPWGLSLRITGPPVYGDFLRYGGKWPHNEIVRDIRTDASNQRHLDRRVKVAMLVDDGFIHAPALNAYARFQGADVRFFNVAYHPDYRTDPGFTQRLIHVLQSPYFITKQEGSLGLDFVAEQYHPLLERLGNPGSEWSKGAQLLASYRTPVNEKVNVWSNDFPAAFLTQTEKVNTKFENGLIVKGYRFTAACGFQKGNLALLQVDWVPEKNEHLQELLETYQFFLHLVNSETGRFLQGWNFPLTEETLETARVHLRAASSGAVVSTVLIEPRDDLFPGRLEFRLGVFVGATLEQVPIADPVGDPEFSIPLGEPFVFEPDGWEWVHASFEDRKMLEARDEVGAVVLEAARFSPASVSPGGEILLETIWTKQHLELETPEERSIRVFACLMPQDSSPSTKPIGRTAKPLKEIVDPEKDRVWETVRMKIPIPSNFSEGEWSIHVGVERPMFQRSFVIRNGSQAHRRSYALKKKLLTGVPGWKRLDARFSQDLLLQGARILDPTTVTGAEVVFQLAWRAESATELIDTGSRCLLFAHLFSPNEAQTIQVHNLPIFAREHLVVRDPRLKKRNRFDFFEAIRSGFVETYRIQLEEWVLPGSYRLKVGLFDPKTGVKAVASLPDDTTATTLTLPEEIWIRSLE